MKRRLRVVAQKCRLSQRTAAAEIFASGVYFVPLIFSKIAWCAHDDLRDISWDLERTRHACLHLPDTTPEEPKYTPSAVRRVSQIFANPVFFEGGKASADVVQGEF